MNKSEKFNEIEIINPYGFIYITTNLINGKKYIGQKVFNKYWQKYLGSGVLLTRSIKKYGRENFSREIISISYSKEELNLLEEEIIKFHNAVNSDNYYNINNGGNSMFFGIPKTIEHKQKISESRKGYRHSDEAKLKMSENTKGNKATEETKKKMSDARKGVNKSDKMRIKLSKSKINHIVSLETRNKIRESLKGNIMSEETKKKMSDTHRKLSDEQVNEIREKYATGKYKQRELVEEYLIGATAINNIINFKGAYKIV